MPSEERRSGMAEFMFATGIECSYPTIDGGRGRIDQLAETGHYRYWRRDLELVRELGLKYLRYGLPLHLFYQGENKFDWSFADEVMRVMQELGFIRIFTGSFRQGSTTRKAAESSKILIDRLKNREGIKNAK